MNNGTRVRAKRVVDAINNLLLEDLTCLNSAEVAALREASELTRRRIIGNCPKEKP